MPLGDGRVRLYKDSIAHTGVLTWPRNPARGERVLWSSAPTRCEGGGGGGGGGWGGGGVASGWMRESPGPQAKNSGSFIGCTRASMDSHGTDPATNRLIQIGDFP